MTRVSDGSKMWKKELLRLMGIESKSSTSTLTHFDYADRLLTKLREWRKHAESPLTVLN